MAEDSKIVLFHYKESIFSHRVLWYLAFRGIKYSQNIQPPYLPRPTLKEKLDIHYRRIPILVIGKDVYCDSRLIINALEERFPGRLLLPSNAFEKGIRELLQSWTQDSGLFWKAAGLLPFETKTFLQDPKFGEDRSEMVGAAFEGELLKTGRPENWAHIRGAYHLLESTLLADGRDWILGGESPTLCDIDAIFPLQWLIADPLMEGALPSWLISLLEKECPKTLAWISRFLAAFEGAKAAAPKPTTLSDEEAVTTILGSTATAKEGIVDPNDPLGLQKGQEITISPTDTGVNHPDKGKLASLTVNEASLINSKGLTIHYQRWGFRVSPVEESRSTKDANSSHASKWRMIYHPLSPYSRKAYMYAIELDLAPRIELDKVVVAPVPYAGWSDDNDKVARFNPLAKIPVLVPEEHEDGIYDSRIIMEFFESEADGELGGNDDDKQRKWRLRTLLACADGMLDAQVLLVYENKIRAEEGMKYDTWAEGQTEKLMRGYDRLEYEAQRDTLRPVSKGKRPSAAEVAVAASLGFGDILGIDWRSSRPSLVKWFKTFEGRESFLATKPDIDWKSGEAGDLGFGNEAISGTKK